MITPSRLPEARDRVLESWKTGALETMLRFHDGPVRVPLDASGRPLPIAEYTRRLMHWMAVAELYYVTDAMTAVCRQAGSSLPAYRLHNEDVPAPIGLVVWASPVVTVEQDYGQWGTAHGAAQPQVTAIRGALWGPAISMTMEGPERIVPGVHVVTFSDTEILLNPDRFEPAQRDHVLNMRASFGPLAYHDECPLPYGEMEREVGNHALGTVMSTWLLMGQQIAVEGKLPVERPLRRAYVRAGRPEPLVRSISLRRAKVPAREADPDAPRREYDHQWIVRGHWRNQWYPSRNDHRPIYISEYVAGPEDKPLKGGEKVNVLRR